MMNSKSRKMMLHSLAVSTVLLCLVNPASAAQRTLVVPMGRSRLRHSGGKTTVFLPTAPAREPHLQSHLIQQHITHSELGEINSFAIDRTKVSASGVCKYGAHKPHFDNDYCKKEIMRHLMGAGKGKAGVYHKERARLKKLEESEQARLKTLEESKKSTRQWSGTRRETPQPLQSKTTPDTGSRNKLRRTDTPFYLPIDSGSHPEEQKHPNKVHLNGQGAVPARSGSSPEAKSRKYVSSTTTGSSSPGKRMAGKAGRPALTAKAKLAKKQLAQQNNHDPSPKARRGVLHSGRRRLMDRLNISEKRGHAC